MKHFKIKQTITDRKESSIELYFKDICRTDLLTPGEELKLTEELKKGSKEAEDKLIVANLRFVVSIAKQYQNKGVPLTDLVQEGSLGLIEGAKKYNPDKVIIEEVAQQSSALTLKLLARIQGIIIGFCAAHNIQTYIVEPSKWRSTLNFSQGAGVKRPELKAQAIDYIKDNLGLELSEDECESICIGIADHKIYNFVNDDIWGED